MLLQSCGVSAFAQSTETPQTSFDARKFDPELTFDTLTQAVRYVLQGLPYVASHPDVLCPSPNGGWPDAGSLIAAIRTATGVKPLAIAGKPNRWIAKLTRQRFNVKASEIMIVGDRLQTDIRMARRFGMRSVLVLTGVTDKATLNQSRYTPDLVVKSVAELADAKWPGKLGWF